MLHGVYSLQSTCMCTSHPSYWRKILKSTHACNFRKAWRHNMDKQLGTPVIHIVVLCLTEEHWEVVIIHDITKLFSLINNHSYLFKVPYMPLRLLCSAFIVTSNRLTLQPHKNWCTNWLHFCTRTKLIFFHSCINVTPTKSEASDGSTTPSSGLECLSHEGSHRWWCVELGLVQSTEFLCEKDLGRKLS